jgi:aldehyde:ferredoxin oxidoreductase
LTATNDVLLERIFKPNTDGVALQVHLDCVKIDKVRRYFYTLMDWDANGVLLPEKVEELYIE